MMSLIVFVLKSMAKSDNFVGIEKRSVPLMRKLGIIELYTLRHS